MGPVGGTPAGHSGCAGAEGPTLPTGTGDEGDGQTPGST